MTYKIQTGKNTELINMQIQYHRSMIKVHTQAVENLLKLCTDNQIKDLSVEEQLFDELHEKDVEVETTDCASREHEDNIIFDIDEQDVIWERIRESQIKQGMLFNHGEEVIKHEPVKMIENESEDHNKIKKVGKKENNLFIEPNLKKFPNTIFKEDNIENNEDIEEEKNILSSNIEEDMKKQKTSKKPPTINALFKLNPNKRSKIIKNIFEKAKENISSFLLNDDYNEEQFNNAISEEADRLLKVYLDTH